MHDNRSHISVCICTHKRPERLRRLLEALQEQTTAGTFTYGVIVVDNDGLRSAEQAVRDVAGRASIPIGYHVEAEQNIALARNKGIANAAGDFVAFIDDDEMPGRDWLLTLYRARETFGADGVLGPVVPMYESTPPAWVVRGRFHERPAHETGDLLPWTRTRTGNVLLRRAIFADPDNTFRRQFGSGGEDRDFFRRMIAKGMRFVWCAEAPVQEAVAPGRCARSFMLRRAWLRGQRPHFTAVDRARSLLILPVYLVSLPLLFVVADHLFMKYAVKTCDHLGRLFWACGISVIKEKYIA